MPRRIAPRLAAQDGTTSLVVAIVMPVILLLVTTAAQVISWQFAQQAVQQAAASGVEAARVRGGNDADGIRVATDTATRFHSVHDVRATVRYPSTGGVEIDVTASTPAVIPGFSIPIHGSARGPLEPRP